MKVLRGSMWAIRLAAVTAPMLLASQILLVILDSAGPAVQVVLINRLVQVGQGKVGQIDGRMIALILVASLVFGLNRVVNSLSMSLSQRLTRRVRQRCEDDLVFAMAAVTPEELMDPNLASEARTARDAIRENVAMHPSYSINSLRAALTMIFLIVALAPYSLWAAILIALAGLPVLFVYTKVSRIEEEGFPKVSHENKYAEYFVQQLIYEVPATELALLGTGRKMAHLAKLRIDRGANIYVKTMAACDRWITAGGVVASAMLAAALFALVGAPGASAGTLAAGVVALISSMGATSDASYTAGVVIASTPVIDKYRTFVEGRLLSGVGSARKSCERAVQSLEVSCVSFSYARSSTQVLDGVSMVARRGQMVGVVGANGAGKTTLIKCIMGALEPSDGEVRIDGHSVEGLSDGERRDIFGMLSQEFGRYELTVRDAVMLGVERDEVADSEIWDALGAAHLRELVEAMPDKLGTQLGAQFGGVGLCGGQWQRLALARIFLRRSPVWILDEPTSAVDAETEHQIFEELGESRQDRITLVVSHRASTLRAMDAIVVLDGGRVVQVGSFDDLSNRTGRFREMFGQV